MHIIFIAPQPFFIERGTPIAIRSYLEAVSFLNSSEKIIPTIHLITCNSGKDIELGTTKHYRAPLPKFIAYTEVGISFKKLINDFAILLYVFFLIFKLGKKNISYLHCVEEALFIGYFAKKILGINYVYDMDSVMSDQVVNKWKMLSRISKLLKSLEDTSIKNAKSVLAVCKLLGDRAIESGAKKVTILEDPAFSLPENIIPHEEIKLLFQNLAGKKIVLYAGNLENYQGIDLLINSFAKTIEIINQKGQKNNIHLLIVGGSSNHRRIYQEQVEKLRVTPHVTFFNPVPKEQLSFFYRNSACLVSPRSEGINTPMKIYGYLITGTPIVATNLPTHTQVLTSDVAFLADATTDSFAEAIYQAISDRELAEKKAESAKKLGTTSYSEETFNRRAQEFFLSTLENNHD